MKRLFGLVVFISATIFNHSYSQNVDVQWGATVKESRRSGILNYIGQDATGYYVLKGTLLNGEGYSGNNRFRNSYLRETANASIVRLDENMNPALEKALEVRESGKQLSILSAFQIGDDMHLFSSFRNQKTKMKHIFVQSVDKKTLEPRKDIRKVTSVPYQNRYLSGKVDFTFSRDSSFLMVYTNVRSKRKDPDKFGFNIFDRNMEPVWNKEVVLPVQENLFQVSDYLVDNEGSAYLVGKRYFRRERDRVKGQPGYEYVVYAYRDGGEDVSEYVLNLRDHFLSDLHLEIAPSGDLICAGFYSDIDATNAKGTFYFTVDAKTQEIKHRSLYEFDLKFLTMNLNDRQGERIEKRAEKGKRNEINQYDIRELVPRGDGGTVLIAEQYYVRVVTSVDRTTGNSTIRYYYHYNDIVVISINPGGDIEWATKIPKRQTSVNDNGYYSSYSMMITGGKLHFIYNDHKLNIVERRSSNLKNFRLNDNKGIIALASVDPEGNVERRPLFSNRDVTTICRPKMCSQISPEEMLFFGKRGKKTQFGSVLFD